MLETVYLTLGNSFGVKVCVYAAVKFRYISRSALAVNSYISQHEHGYV